MTCIPFRYILPLVESTSKAFRALTKSLPGFSEGAQTKNPRRDSFAVRLQGLEPWTISLKGSRSTI